MFPKPQWGRFCLGGDLPAPSTGRWCLLLGFSHTRNKARANNSIRMVNLIVFKIKSGTRSIFIPQLGGEKQEKMKKNLKGFHLIHLLFVELLPSPAGAAQEIFVQTCLNFFQSDCLLLRFWFNVSLRVQTFKLQVEHKKKNPLKGEIMPKWSCIWNFHTTPWSSYLNAHRKCNRFITGFVLHNSHIQKNGWTLSSTFASLQLDQTIRDGAAISICSIFCSKPVVRSLPAERNWSPEDTECLFYLLKVTIVWWAAFWHWKVFLTQVHAKPRQWLLVLFSENCKGKTEKKEEKQQQLKWNRSALMH